MKRILLAALMLTAFGALQAQIVDVQQKGSWLYIYGENNKKLSSMGLGSSDEFLGMGSSFVVIKRGSWIYTYDANSRKIGSMGLGSADKFKSAVGNSFNIQKGSWIYTYDKNCKKLSSRAM